jgi:CRISPR/Cas system CSM-associated protein Csm3 (group 7 of RAMP superfamily)
MTSGRPQRPNQPTDPKPYELISLPSEPPQRERPVGQHRYDPTKLSGSISLTLQVKNPIFIASGVVVRGQDISAQHKNIPLIKVGVNEDNRVLIPGSSLKGAIRAAYEAITRSCLCKTRVDKAKIPNGFKECDRKDNLCPTCRVFGAMGWQGLIGFSDAIGTDIKSSIGFMPSLYSPQNKRIAYFKNGKVAGRKFYYHAVKAVSKGQKGIPVQQIGIDSTFKTKLSFKNLSAAEIGTLLTVLGVSPRHDFALKIGGGKPIGMGTVKVKIDRIEALNNLRNRYLSYDISEDGHYQGDELNRFIDRVTKDAENQLIQPKQLGELKEIWKYPTNRPAPEGMY